VNEATFTTHGHAHSGKRSPEYQSWTSMLARVRGRTGRRREMYGDRGIAVCERWEVFENFLADMGSRPPGTSLDRIDNDGDYMPDNCRWATAAVQARNQRRIPRVEWRGESLTKPEWAERIGIPHATIQDRLYRGWTPERAFTTPVKKPKP
jgi:hypothetical protein